MTKLNGRVEIPKEEVKYLIQLKHSEIEEIEYK